MQISVISNLFILKCYFFVASLASMSAQSNVICIGRKMSIVPLTGPLTRRVLSLRKQTPAIRHPFTRYSQYSMCIRLSWVLLKMDLSDAWYFD